MPARPRKEIVASDEIGFYHCMSRCVRQAFLCGVDETTGNNYDHRKVWIEQRLKFLAGVMAVEVASHAVMSNHLHVVLRIRPDLVKQWSDREVARRWLTVCPGKRELDRDAPQEPPTRAEIEAVLADEKKLVEYRKRLCSLSWFMKLWKEPIARRANEEDGRRGHFFEGRFKSTRLLDVFGLLTCLMYVDLNEIRAGISATPESSRFTSAYLRIQARKARRARQQGKSAQKFNPLAAAFLTPIDESTRPPDGLQAKQGQRASDDGCLPMSLEKYLELLDWTGRQVRRGKRGAIPANLAPILQRLEVDVAIWLDTVEHFDTIFRTMAGRSVELVQQAAAMGLKWLCGVRRESRSKANTGS